MIVIKNKDPYWIVNLMKDLDSLGIPNVYDGLEVKCELCNKKISLHNHYKNDYRNNFTNINNNFITEEKDFVTIDIKGLKEHFEKLLEKHKERKHAKNLISFDAEMFAMLFDGKVDKISGLTVTEKNLNFAKGKCANIELNYFGDMVFLHYSSAKKYVDLKDIDLFEVPWSATGIVGYITLTEFFEKFEDESVKTISESITKLEYNKTLIENELKFLETTPKTKRDEQCKKDIIWRKSEIQKLQQQIKYKVADAFEKLNNRYNCEED